MFNPKISSLIIFIIAYFLFVVFPKKRHLVAAGATVALVVFRVLTIKEAFEAINWNVMGIFIGTLTVANTFMASRVPAFLAELIVDKSKNTAWAIIYICILTGFISAFVENVATVLIVAPIALELTRKLKINPINIIIAIAVSSNLQGCATLIGDSPSMLLGGIAKMSFSDFFFYKGKPALFFAVEIGAAVSIIVLYLFFYKHREKIILIPVEKVKSWIPTIILCALIILLAVSSFFHSGFSNLAGILCMTAAATSLLFEQIRNKRSIFAQIRALDWNTTLFLLGVFVMVGSLSRTGWIESITSYLSLLVGRNLFIGYTLLVLVAIIFSAFVDNVPFLAAMLPVAMSMATKLNVEPELFLFGLLIGASLGGNITPIGASANIVACGLLKNEGYHVKFLSFLKIGIPFTFAAAGAAYLFIWFVWS